MTDPDFPEALRSFIEETIPTIDAAELLVLISHNSARAYSIQEAVDAMRPTAVTEPAVRRYLTHFQARGLVAVREGESYQYVSVGSALGETVRALTRVYNERPVTLVRMIYAPKDEKIRSFADAFRIKK